MKNRPAITRSTPASPATRRWRPAWLLALALAGGQPGQAQPADDAVVRGEIAEQRARAELRYQQQRVECSHRFLVTACMEDARAAYRSTIDGLDRREAEIDRRLRHERAQQRLAIIRQKTDALARLAPLPAAATAEEGAPAAADEAGRAPAARSSADAGGGPSAAAERAARARAEAAQRRRAEAQRRSIEREREQAAGQKKPPAAGLPERPPIPLPKEGSGR